MTKRERDEDASDNDKERRCGEVRESQSESGRDQRECVMEGERYRDNEKCEKMRERKSERERERDGKRDAETARSVRR